MARRKVQWEFKESAFPFDQQKGCSIALAIQSLGIDPEASAVGCSSSYRT